MQHQKTSVNVFWDFKIEIRHTRRNSASLLHLGYVHTGPVPNGSVPKIVPDRPFVHTGPANRTVNPFPIRSENWTSKKAGPVFGTVPVPNGSVTV